MKVFTFFNHGTGGWSGKSFFKNEIVNIFSKLHADIPHLKVFEDYMITEGVGGGGNPFLRQVDISGDGASSYVRDGTPLLRNIQTGLSAAFGFGVRHNVSHAVRVIHHLTEIGKKPDIINMIGWSRGAVTCIRIAYALKHGWGLSSLIPVNIFAIDPVPGGGAISEPDAHTVTSNVKNFVSTLAIHEKRAAFAPVHSQNILFQSASTKRLSLPIYGIHSDTAKFNNPAGRVSFALCYRFLSHFGTLLPEEAKMFHLTDDKFLQDYQKMIFSGEGHKYDSIKKRNKFSAAFTGGWSLLGGRKKLPYEEMVSDSEYFVNEHHKCLFFRKYPLIADAFFGAGRSILFTQNWERIWMRRILDDPISKTLPEEMFDRLLKLDGKRTLNTSPDFALMRHFNFL